MIIAQHHWPTRGNENIVKLMKGQRDMYRYINDQTLRMANKGLTRDKIAAEFKLPESLENSGRAAVTTAPLATTSKPPTCFISAGSTATRQPSTSCRLNRLRRSSCSTWAALMPSCRKPKRIISRVITVGLLRWSAKWSLPILTTGLRNLEADALEQLGYRAEAGTGVTST